MSRFLLEYSANRARIVGVIMWTVRKASVIRRTDHRYPLLLQSITITKSPSDFAHCNHFLCWKHQRPRWLSPSAASPAARSLATNGRPISTCYKPIFQRVMPLMNWDCVDIAAEGWWVFTWYVLCGVTCFVSLHTIHTILTLTISCDVVLYGIISDVNTRGSDWKITEL